MGLPCKFLSIYCYIPFFLFIEFSVFSMTGKSLMLLHVMGDQYFVQGLIVPKGQKILLLELLATCSLETG